MLAQAAEKCRGAGPIEPIFLHQAMEELDLYGTIDACVCAWTAHYVTSPKKLARAFRRVHTFLMPGGLFLFDINTPQKLRGLDGQMFLDESEDAYCVWRADWSERPAHLHLWNGHLPAGSRRAVEPLGGGSRGVRLRTGGAGGAAPAGRFPAGQTIRRAEGSAPPREGEQRIFFAARKEF